METFNLNLFLPLKIGRKLFHAKLGTIENHQNERYIILNCDSKAIEILPKKSHKNISKNGVEKKTGLIFLGNFERVDVIIGKKLLLDPCRNFISGKTVLKAPSDLFWQNERQKKFIIRFKNQLAKNLLILVASLIKKTERT